MAFVQPDLEPTDAVTTLQEQVKSLSQTLYTFIGALQRDAPPSSLAGEPVVEPRPNADVFQQVMSMPQQMVSLSKSIDDLIRLLPEGDTEEADMAEIVRLQQESNDLDAGLAEALHRSEDTLLAAQELYAQLAKHQIGVEARREPHHDRLPHSGG